MMHIITKLLPEVFLPGQTIKHTWKSSHAAIILVDGHVDVIAQESYFTNAPVMFGGHWIDCRQPQPEV
jgi:hypothetical protein